MNEAIKTLILTGFTIFTVVACATSQPLSPHLAQQILVGAWQADQHVVWELDWPAAPIGGPLTVETWRAGNRYRYEILESATPALIGETLVFDGQRAWQYNRFNPPLVFSPTLPALSPISDAFTIINRLIDTLPETAGQEMAQINFNSTQKIMATFANGDSLVLWRDVETHLPARLVFFVAGQQATLNARDAKPLLNPPEELFGVGDWVY